MRANYSREQLAALLGLKVQTLAAWACRGRGPRFWKRRRRVLYRAADVAAYLDDPAAYDAARGAGLDKRNDDDRGARCGRGDDFGARSA